jgi:peptide/nickel transport system substrate-binding protein
MLRTFHVEANLMQPGRPLWGVVIHACVVAFLVSSAAACRNAHSGRASADASSITVLYPGDERVMGPYWEMPAKFLVFLPLVRLGEDGELVPVLARAWEHSADYRTWTIHLRDDVRWHDGRPVTAHDVRFTAELLAHPAVMWASPDWYAIELIDDHTYRITCRDARLNPLSTWQVFYPKHLLEDLDPTQFAQWEFWTAPVGNGPYRYVRHVPKTAIELAANADYYAGKPAIDRVVLRLTSGGGLTELLAGQADASAFLKPTDALKIAREPGFRLYYEADGGNLRAIAWNQRHAPLSDARVRRALTLAIDRRELLRVVNLPQELPIVDGLFTERQFRRGLLPAPLPFDPGRAAALLDAAGWRPQAEDGVRARNGIPLAFALLVSPEEETEAVYVQNALGRVGVRVTIERLDLNVVRRRLRSGEFQASIRIFTNALGGNFGHLRMFGPESPLGYHSPRVVELLERAGQTLDPAMRDDIYAQLAEIFAADVPMTFLYPAAMYAAARDRVAGLQSPYRAEPAAWMEHLRLEKPR